jgi:predicted nucleotidyltransferase
VGGRASGTDDYGSMEYILVMAATSEDLAAVLLDRARSERVRESDRGERIASRLRGAVCQLRAAGAFEAAWLVGSLAWGGFGRRSDVDVVVRGADSSRIGALAGRLSDAVDASVDLLALEDLPEGFRRRVLSLGVRLDEP